MNVLHLLDESCSPDSRAEARALPGDGEPLVLADNLATCLARPGAELRRRLAGVQAVVCWSARLAATAVRAQRLLPVFVRLLEAPSEDDIGLLARLRAGGGSVTVVCHTPAIAWQLERDCRGHVAVIPAAAIVSGDAPATASGRETRRAEARRRYGLAPDDIAVIAPGRVSEASRHKQAVWAAAILCEAGLAMRILLPGGGLWAREAAAFAADAGFGKCCVQAGADELDRLVAAGELALLLHEGPIPPVSLASVMAGGVPIVAGLQAQTGEVAFGAARPLGLDHERTALLVDANQPRLIAGGLLRLIEDRDLAGRLAAEAQQEVAGQSLAAVAGAWRALVAQSPQ